MLELLKNPIAVGLLTLISTTAATFAAYYSWRQLSSQKLRWRAEDARRSPIVYIGLSGSHSIEGWFHGVWQITNRADHEIKLIEIEAVTPQTLKIGALDPTTDGPVESMKVMNPGRVITIEQILKPTKPPLDQGLIAMNFLYRISNTPELDRGKTIRLRFHFCDVENPEIRYEKYGEAVGPGTTNG